MTQTYYSPFHPTAVSPGSKGSTVPIVSSATITSMLADLTVAMEIGDDDKLTPLEKQLAIRFWNDINNEYADIDSRATTLGIGTERTAWTAAYSALSAYLTSLSPAWNSTTTTTTIVRSAWNSAWSTYYDARITLEKRISEEDAIRSTWNLTSGRPPLLTGPSVTVDETFKDPSVYSISNITFGSDATGEGYVETPAVTQGLIRHLVTNSVPVDFNGTYEASWEIQELGAGAGVAKFYTIVECFDASGNWIAGDGTYWYYPTSNLANTTRGIWEKHSARFGKGTDRPFPAGTVRWGLGIYTNFGATAGSGITRVRRMAARKLTTLEMEASVPRYWTLGDGRAIREGGVTANWGVSMAYGRATIKGAQRLSWRWSGPNSVGPKMVGLSEGIPTSYSSSTLCIYYSDTDNVIVIFNGGATVATYTGITTRNSDEFAIEYDGLYLYPLRNGVRMGYSLYVGADKTYRMFVDSYYVGQGAIQLFHVSAASLSVIGSNTVDINGNPVSLDSLRNNLIDVGWWKKGAAVPWVDSGVSGAARLMVSTPSDINVAGLKANPEDSLLVFKPGASGATSGGGWSNGAPSTVVGINPDKAYRFILPVRRIGGDSILHWGVDGSSVALINTTTAETNPYFVVASAGLLETDRWYILVGYVYPRNSTFKSHDSAGMYDCRTGKKVAGTTNNNFCFLPSFTSLSHRAFQYYGTTDSSALFGKPMCNVVDGTEPEISTFFEQTSALEDVSLDWTTTGGHIAQGNSITKTLGAGVGWDSKAITRQSYKSNAFVSGRLETDGFLGLHELGNTNVSYISMEHSVHRSGDGNWYYWSGSAAVLNMGTSRNGITFGNLTDWALFYDNATLKIFADGVSMHEVTATPDRVYQGGVALYNQTHLVSNIRFGPYTENTAVTTLPPDNVVINANSSGTVISGQFNKVMTPTVKRGGTDFRTNNRMTYTVTDITSGLTGFVTVNNTAGSSGKGQVTVTGITATGTFKLNIFYDGVLLNAYVCEVKIVPAPPSLGGGGGGGTKSGSVSIGGVSMDTTTFIELGRISGLVKGTSETIKCTLASGTFTHYAGGTFQSRNVTGKFQYSVAGAESWTDVGSGVTSSAASDWDPELFYSSPGYLTVIQNVAPSNNTYDIRFMCAETTTGTGATSFDIHVTVSVIIEV